MNPRTFLLPAVFLGTSIPTVLLLHFLDIGGDFRIAIAIGVGVVATAFTQGRMARRKDDA
jgi:hypothetical protein